jgi:chromosomal replication initiator protein
MYSEVETKKIWDYVLGQIELEVSGANFNTWFKETYLKEISSGIAKVAVPNQFVKNWLIDKYSKTLLKHLIDKDDNIRTIEYIIEKITINKTKQKEAPSKNDKLPLDNFYINKEDNLNQKYTFDSFVVGSFNELAYSAAQAIVKNSTVVYNPFFVYGKTGHGKTHLIQSIGNHIKKHHPEKKVYYITTEKFQMDVVEFVGLKNKANDFKNKYRKYDVLIMDDIQFLSKKETTQEELFHLFNYLHDNNKQIILSSDKHPNQIPDLEERLKSRFNAGMTVDIQEPDFESRIEILKSKARENNFILSDSVIDHIASSINGNIRELEGILNSVLLQSQLKQKELTINDVKDLIKNNIKKKKVLKTEEVVQIVSDYYDIDQDYIYKKIRKKEFVKPRQIIMYLLREDFKVSFPTIGEKLGGRDHTTVMHSCEKVKKDLAKDFDLQKEIEDIRSMF